MATRTMSITEVKAHLLGLVTEIGDTGDEIVITRRGRPVARLLPEAGPRSLIGSVIFPEDEDAWDLSEDWGDPCVTDPIFGTEAEQHAKQPRRA